MTLKDHIARIAMAELGVEESPRGSNRGPRVDQYQAATWLSKKDWGPWCASFICWVMRDAMAAAVKYDAMKFTFKRPQTAKVFDLEDWSLKQDNSTRTRRSPGRDILPWDIVIFDFSHVGFATSEPDKQGWVTCLEGNTNDDGSREGYKVCLRRRRISSIICRIRIAV